MKKSDIVFDSRRSTVYGTHGMVACCQPLAAQVGMDVLKNGGNAADAAVATEPTGSGIGGDAFCLYYNAKTGTVKGLDGAGRTPAALTYSIACEDSMLMDKAEKDKSIHCVTVPGALAAYNDTLKHFGSKNFSLTDAMLPTIEMAERGVPISQIIAMNWRTNLTSSYKKEVLSKHDWAIDGIRGPEEGDIITVPGLAKTYRQLATEGIDAFYSGSIGENIIQVLQSHGSVMTMEDLSNHSSTLFEPISMDYHGSTIWQVPPVSQGIATLMALGIIEALEEHHKVDFSKMEHNSSEYIHIVTEALRLVFSDLIHYVSDASTTTVPVELLLNKEYLRERAKLVDLKQKNENVQNGYPIAYGNTTYVSVVDQQGNACSFMVFDLINAPTVPDTGISLHNRGMLFSMEKNHPNAIGPSKKPLHTLMPSMMTRKTEKGHVLEACFGIIGGFMQHQGQVQLIMNMKHYMSNPQRILDVPRFCLSPTKEKRFDHNNVPSRSDSIIYLEKSFAKGVANELVSKGHICRVLDPVSIFGRAQIIFSKIDPRSGRRVLSGGSDPRADGQAIGW
ncbi:gamma-glutamyltranspeptidase [Backusella circina FSU 941]|nr:gamma-glutamyltranspeptidase [Backusella circina FSU 941]